MLKQNVWNLRSKHILVCLLLISYRKQASIQTCRQKWQNHSRFWKHDLKCCIVTLTLQPYQTLDYTMLKTLWHAVFPRCLMLKKVQKVFHLALIMTSYRSTQSMRYVIITNDMIRQMFECTQMLDLQMLTNAIVWL